MREEIWPITPDPDEYAIDNDEAITQEKIDDMWAAFLEALRLGPKLFEIPDYWPIELQEYLRDHGFQYADSHPPPGTKK